MAEIKLSVVIPAYNEEETIESTIHNIQSIRAKLQAINVALTIIVIDDGSTDNTASLAQNAGANFIISHKTNRGLGAAVRTGLTEARRQGSDIAVKYDADLQHVPDNIVDIIQPILGQTADIVYGERFSQIEYKMPIVRKMGNRFFTWFMRILTGWPLKDSQPGIFAINRDYLALFEIPGDYNYTQQILLDAYLNGMRFAHVPVAFKSRTTGHSFVSLKYPFKVMPQIILVICMTKPLKIFGPIGLFFCAIGGIIFLYQCAEFFLGMTPRPVMNVFFVLGSILFGTQILMLGLLAKIIVVTNKRQQKVER